jgi:hypothetical protein
MSMRTLMSDHHTLHDPDDDDIPPSSIELEKIPRRLWEQTLAPLHRQERALIARQVADEQLREVAWELASELDMAESRRHRAAEEARLRARRAGVPLPTPHADDAVLRPTVQLNIRLRRDDHERLAQASVAVVLRPTTLARALVLNGAAQILREHARTADDAGRRAPSRSVAAT